MSESVTVVIFENIDYEHTTQICDGNINLDKENEIDVFIDKVCNSLVIKNNELDHCKKNFTTKNSTKIYCDDHEYKNNICKDISECCICFENINKNNEIPLDCGHLFHKECLLKTNKTTCPLCKISFTEIEINYIKYKNEIQINENQQNLGVCDVRPGRKIIFVLVYIFSLLLLIYSIL